jgi:Uncharacterized conserved protein
VTGARNDLILQTTTGDIVATDISSPSVDASTAAGDIRLSYDDAPVSVSARTRTGDISIVVPPGPSYRVEAATRTGDQRITVRQNLVADRTISARTTTGDIDIRYS